MTGGGISPAGTDSPRPTESPLTDEGNREVGETVFRALLDAAGPTGSIQVAFRIFPEHVEVDVLHSDNQILASPGLVNGPAAGVAPTVRAAPAMAPPAGPPTSGPSTTGAAPGSRAPVSPAPAAPVPEPAAFSQLTPGVSEPAAATGGPPGASGPGAPAAPHVAPAPAGPVTLGQPGHPDTFAEWMSTALRREGLTQEAAARQLGVSVKTVSRWVGGATEPRMRDLRRIQEVFGQVPLP